MEILKQGQYVPVSVENQVAIIYVTTYGMLDHVPVNRISEFEKEFIERLHLKHGDQMKSIADTGAVSDEVAELLTKEAEEMVLVYTEES